ncbi:hypothetical protein JW835_05850 [bacterium]|nr:hypothetical protein [bacterium]
MRFIIYFFLITFLICPLVSEAKFNFSFDVYQKNNKGSNILRISPLGHRGGFSTSMIEAVSEDIGSFFPLYANIILFNISHPWLKPKYFESKHTTRVPIFSSYIYFGFGYAGDSYRRIGLSFYFNPIVAVPLELKIDYMNYNRTESTSLIVSYAIGTWLSIGR